jgi:hypothetical protein
MEADRNTTNIDGKKYILPTEKLIICEIVDWPPEVLISL